LCVFHVIKDINKLVLDAVRRLRNAMKETSRGSPPAERGSQVVLLLKDRAASR
jgi:hypothetical protein